jgi:hypothetical protein
MAANLEDQLIDKVPNKQQEALRLRPVNGGR